MTTGWLGLTGVGRAANSPLSARWLGARDVFALFAVAVRSGLARLPQPALLNAKLPEEARWSVVVDSPI